MSCPGYDPSGKHREFIFLQKRSLEVSRNCQNAPKLPQDRFIKTNFSFRTCRKRNCKTDWEGSRTKRTKRSSWWGLPKNAQLWQSKSPSGVQVTRSGRHRNKICGLAGKRRSMIWTMNGLQPIVQQLWKLRDKNTEVSQLLAEKQGEIGRTGKRISKSSGIENLWIVSRMPLTNTKCIRKWWIGRTERKK